MKKLNLFRYCCVTADPDIVVAHRIMAAGNLFDHEETLLVFCFSQVPHFPVHAQRQGNSQNNGGHAEIGSRRYFA